MLPLRISLRNLHRRSKKLLFKWILGMLCHLKESPATTLREGTLPKTKNPRASSETTGQRYHFLHLGKPLKTTKRINSNSIRLSGRFLSISKNSTKIKKNYKSSENSKRSRPSVLQAQEKCPKKSNKKC